MRTRALAMLKMARIMEALDPDDRTMIAYEMYRTYGGALTEAQRAARYRGKRHEAVTEASRNSDEPPSLSRDERATTPSTSSTTVLLTYYGDLFEKKFKTKPRINYGKDGALVKSLLRQFEEAKLRDLLERFFASDDEFIRKSGHTIGVFASQINKLLVNGMVQSEVQQRFSRKGQRTVENAQRWIAQTKADSQPPSSGSPKSLT